jgi:hypothetical protein
LRFRSTVAVVSERRFGEDRVEAAPCVVATGVLSTGGSSRPFRLTLILIALLAFGAIGIATDAGVGVSTTSPVVSERDRREIERADCRQLRALDASFAANADSDLGAMRARELVDQRAGLLGCWVDVD